MDVLRESLAPCETRIACAFVHGSIARSEELATSDVNLIVVGEVGLADLAPALRSAEQRLGRPTAALVVPAIWVAWANLFARV